MLFTSMQVPQANISTPVLIRAYIDLIKPRIVTMVSFTTSLGYLLGAAGTFEWPHLFLSIMGTALCCAGAGALNNFLEKDFDCAMPRTAKRPLPCGLITPAEALGFGLLLVLAGSNILAWQVNPITGFLAVLTAFTYVLIYTPLKRMTWLNTMIGAIPGALPPVGGWTAATGTLDWGALTLFLILYVWQHPHFYAISWMYREDYAQGGYKMISSERPAYVFSHSVWFAVLLIPVSLMLSYFRITGLVYATGAAVMGLYFLMLTLKFAQHQTTQAAKMVFRVSVIYLPILLSLAVFNRI